MLLTSALTSALTLTLHQHLNSNTYPDSLTANRTSNIGYNPSLEFPPNFLHNPSYIDLSKQTLQRNTINPTSILPLTPTNPLLIPLTPTNPPLIPLTPFADLSNNIAEEQPQIFTGCYYFLLVFTLSMYYRSCLMDPGYVAHDQNGKVGACPPVWWVL